MQNEEKEGEVPLRGLWITEASDGTSFAKPVSRYTCGRYPWCETHAEALVRQLVATGMFVSAEAGFWTPEVSVIKPDLISIDESTNFCIEDHESVAAGISCGEAVIMPVVESEGVSTSVVGRGVTVEAGGGAAVLTGARSIRFGELWFDFSSRVGTELNVDSGQAEKVWCTDFAEEPGGSCAVVDAATEFAGEVQLHVDYGAQAFAGFGAYACYCGDPLHGGFDRGGGDVKYCACVGVRVFECSNSCWRKLGHVVKWHHQSQIVSSLRLFGTGDAVCHMFEYEGVCYQELVYQPYVYHMPRLVRPEVVRYWVKGNVRRKFATGSGYGLYGEFLHALVSENYVTSMVTYFPEGMVRTGYDYGVLGSLGTIVGYSYGEVVLVAFVANATDAMGALMRYLHDALHRDVNFFSLRERGSGVSS